MSMLSISGKVVNVFTTEAKTDKETGEITPEKTKLQIMGSIALPDGQTKFDLVTLSAPKSPVFDDLENKKVIVPVGVFAPSKGNTVFFVPKGAEPKVLS